MGLGDDLRARRDVEDRLAEVLERPPAIQQFEPRHGLPVRLRPGTQRVAYAFGAGLTETFRDEGEGFRLR